MGQLKLNNVVKAFGNFEALKHISLDVQDGEFMVFVGPSGCGKSTLLRMIAGLEHTTRGDIMIDGKRVNDLPPVKRGIAMVFQSYALYPHMSVYENIAFPLRVEKAPEAVIKDKVEMAAKTLHLDQRLQEKPGMLSGGQRQRVAIGRAIVREPKIFLFDEPLSNLDAALRADMRIELTRLHKQLDTTMIYVTHDQVEAMTMADRIVVLHDGYIAQVGAPLELYHKPQNMFVAGFIGNPSMNFIPVTCTSVSAKGVSVEVAGQKAVIPVKGRDDLKGQILTLGIRPEHVRVGERASFSIKVVPSFVEQLGQQTIGYSQIESQEAPFCFVLSGTREVQDTQSLTVGIDVADCHLFDADGNALERKVELSALSLPV